MVFDLDEAMKQGSTQTTPQVRKSFDLDEAMGVTHPTIQPKPVQPVQQASKPTGFDLDVAMQNDVQNNVITGKVTTNAPKQPTFFNKIGNLFKSKETKEREAFLSQYNDTNVPTYMEVIESVRNGSIDNIQAQELINRRKQLDSYMADAEAAKTIGRARADFGIGLALAAIPGVGGIGGKLASGVVKNLLAKQTAKGLIKNFGKVGTRAVLTAPKIAGTAVDGAIDGAVFGALDYGLDKYAFGENPEDTLGQRVGEFTKTGAMIGGGFGAGGALAKPTGKLITNSKLGKSVGEAIDSNEKLSHTIANISNALNTEVKFGSKAYKYKKLEKALQKSGMPEDEINANLLAYSKLPKKQQKLVSRLLYKKLTTKETIVDKIKAGQSADEVLDTIKNKAPEGKIELKDMPDEDIQKVIDNYRETTQKPVIANKVAEDINTPKQELPHVKNDTGMVTTNEPDINFNIKEPIKTPVKKTMSLKYSKDADLGDDITHLEAGQAEGANTLHKFTKGEENIYNKVTEAERYNNGMSVKDTTKYSNKDPEFMKWFDEYEKASDATKNAMLIDKLGSYTNKADKEAFYEEFTRQLDRDVNRTRAKQIGDVITDQADVSEVGRLTEIEKLVDTPDIKAVKQKTPPTEQERAVATATWKSLLGMKARKVPHKMVIEGTMNKYYSQPERAQEIYNNYYNKIRYSNTTGKVREVLLDDLNEAADNYTKHSGNTLKRYSDIAGETVNANKLLDDIKSAEGTSKAEKLIQNNKFLLNKTGKYKGNDVIDSHYTAKANKAIEEINRLTNKEAVLAEARAIAEKYKNPAKRKKALKDIETNPNKYIEQARLKAKAIYEKNKKIIENSNTDFSNREIYKFDKNGNRTATGDTWDRTSSNVENNLKAKQVTRELEQKINLESKDFGEIGQPIKDIKNSKFAKADRYFTSHKVADFVDDIANGNSEVANCINKYVKNTFDFDELPVGKHGRYNPGTGNITINSNNPIEKQLETIRHEITHVLQEAIAEACGKGSREYEIFTAGRKANSATQKFEKENPSIREKYKTYIDLCKDRAKNEQKIKDFIKENIEDCGKIDEYADLMIQYRDTHIEMEARSAGKGEWKFFGKDIKDYEEILRLHRGRTGQIYKRNTNVTKRGKIETNDEWGREIRSYDVDASRVQRGQPTSRVLEDKDVIGLSSLKEVAEKYNKTKEQAKHIVDKANKEIRTLSDETENLLIKRGIITEEQAINRKKMTDTDIYIADRPEYHGDGSIDLTRDYSDTKAGVTGQRKKETVRELGFEGFYKNTQARNIQAKYVDSVLDIVEKEFAKPIENGRVLTGYKAVNTDLLASAMFGRYSKQWYNTVSDGSEAIRKSFKDDNMAKALEELSERTKGDTFQIPEEVFNSLFTGKGETAADFVVRYGSKAPLQTIGKVAGSINDAMIERFKQRVLTSSSFFVNNRIGNQIMIAAKSDNPVEYIKSLMDAVKTKDDEVIQGVLENNIVKEIYNFNIRKKYTGWQPLDTAFNLFGGQLLDTKNIKGFKRLSAKTANVIGVPAKGFAKVSDALMTFNQKFENFERKQVYSQVINRKRMDIIKRTGQKMVTQKELAELINKDTVLKEAIIRDIQDVLGDYNNFSKFEQNFCKRVVPFYSWYRTISRHTLKLAKENPTRAALIMLELDDMKHGKQLNLKEYQRGSIKLPFKNRLTGEKMVINKSRIIPYNTFRDDMGFNPNLVVPAEAIKGKKFFQNQELTNNRYTRFKVGKEYKYYDNKANKVLDKLPLSTRLGYASKQLIWNNVFPYLENPLLNINKLSGSIKNKISKDNKHIDRGTSQPYDKTYDASILGGYNIGDTVGRTKYKNKYGKTSTKTLKRTGKSRYPVEVIAANQLAGLTIQNENYVNKYDKEKDAISITKLINWRNKHKKKGK